MNLYLKEVKSGILLQAIISPAIRSDMPQKKDGWNFNWRELYTVDGAQFYKVTLKDSPSVVEGMMMLSVLYGEMVYLNNVEVSPKNFGKGRNLDFVAGTLLAYACQQGFAQGKGNYQGYVSFESKTKLIGLYQEKYGATLAMGQKMFFDPEAGKKLIKEFL